MCAGGSQSFDSPPMGRSKLAMHVGPSGWSRKAAAALTATPAWWPACRGEQFMSQWRILENRSKDDFSVAVRESFCDSQSDQSAVFVSFCIHSFKTV